MAGELHYHLMGIGGTGMSTLADLLLSAGVRVSGCDLKPSPAVVEYLGSRGARVWPGHDPSHLDGVDRLVLSSAIPHDHPERVEAIQRGIPVQHRVQVLAELVEGRRLVAVAGAHGKTTVTALCAHVLAAVGQDPLAAVGFALPGHPTGARWGAGAWAVAEADESDGSFLFFRPEVAVVTNIEADHLENYRGSFEQLLAAYQLFLDQVRPGGIWVLGVDSPAVQRVRRDGPHGSGLRVVTYGLREGAEWTAREIRLNGRGSSFEALHRGEAVARVTLAIPGRHNVANALAVLAVCDATGVEPARAAQAMASFVGARRRFEIVGQAGDVMVVDDYAHHPTEVAATLQAAADGYARPIVAVFQPHRYHRTALLLEELAASFGAADRLILTEVYAPPPERPIPDVDGRRLAEVVAARPEWRGRQEHVAFCPTLDAAFHQAMRWAQPGTLVLVMGAGDISQLAYRLAAALQPGAARSRAD